MTRFPLRSTILLALVLALATGLYHYFRPLPAGLALSGPSRAVTNVRFLFDATWVDRDGQTHKQQQIFDHLLEVISKARKLIVLDMFLINDFAGDPARHRALGDELSQALIARQAAVPELQVIVITDPFNTLYGAVENRYLKRMEQAGIRVVYTRLSALRDPNPLWSSLWRVCCQWFGNRMGGGWLPNPVGEQPVTLRSYLSLMNFKANHRKVLIADDQDRWTGVVSSGNPHDASSAHGNVALSFSGPAVADLIASEQAVLALSGEALSAVPALAEPRADEPGETLQVLTEGAIRERVLELLASAGTGDQIRLAMFYFSHRPILDALRAAHQRGASVSVLMDPSEDAFGRKKNGVPNRQVGGELQAAGIPVRWCATHGEQCHSKMLLLDRADGSASLLVGSANFTRRNLDNFNLETSVLLQAAAGHPAMRGARELFMRQWFNLDGQIFSADFPRYQDESHGRYLLYRLMEATGLSTF